jgi:hypothetical protein
MKSRIRRAVPKLRREGCGAIGVESLMCAHLGDTPVCPGREEVMGEMSPSDSPHPYSKSVSSQPGRGIRSAS